VDQRVSRGRVGGLEPHGQGPEAALGGPLEHLAALQERLVEVEADVRLQALGETLQDLRVEHGSEQTRLLADVKQGKRRSCRSVGVQGFIMCHLVLGGGGGGLQANLGFFSPEKFDTIATCVLSFFSKPIDALDSLTERRHRDTTTERRHAQQSPPSPP